MIARIPTKSAIKIGLHVIGMLMMGLAFLARQVSSVPVIQGLMAPSYTRAAAAADLLLNRDVLVPSDQRFVDLETLFKKVLLQNNNSLAAVSAAKVTRFVADAKGVATLI